MRSDCLHEDRMAAFTSHQPVLPPALAAAHHTLAGRAGRLGYYVGGNGPPLLLVHSINAAGSAYEVKPIFQHMVHRHRTYALDLPGFGTSDRSGSAAWRWSRPRVSAGPTPRCRERSRAAPARCRVSTGSSRYRCGAKPSTTFW